MESPSFQINLDVILKIWFCINIDVVERWTLRYIKVEVVDGNEEVNMMPYQTPRPAQNMVLLCFESF